MLKKAMGTVALLLSMMVPCLLSMGGCSAPRYTEESLIPQFPTFEVNAEKHQLDFGSDAQSRIRALHFSVYETFDSRTYSWVLGKQGSVFSWLAEPSKLALRVTVRPFIPPGRPPQVLSLYCNGHFCGRRVLPPLWSDQYYEIDPAFLTVGYNEFQFSCEYTYVPAEVRHTGDEGDHRRLGVAFDKITIEKKSFSGQRLGERTIRQVNNAIVQSPGTCFSTYRYVPSGCVVLITLGKGATDGRKKARAAPLIYQVGLYTKNDGEVISETTFTHRGDEGEKWRIDLSSFSGKLVKMSFSVRSPVMGLKADGRQGIWKNILLRYRQNKDDDTSFKNTPPDVDRHRQNNGFRNLAVILIDTFRADALGCYGNNGDTSPEVDRLSKQSTVFSEARANASWTRPSVASLFTGLLPFSHRVLQSTSKLTPSTTRISSLLKKKGYRTAAISSNPQISRYFGFASGFDTFKEVFGTVTPQTLTPATLDRLLNAKEVEKTLYPLLEKLHNSEKPYFLYLHLMDPHSPYNAPSIFQKIFYAQNITIKDHPKPPNRKKTPPEPFSSRGAGNTFSKYLGEIRFVDQALGRIIKAILNTSKPTQLAIIGDHGEEFYEHGGMGHGRWLFEETLRIPTILRGDGEPAINSADITLKDLGSLLINIVTNLKRGTALLSNTHNQPVFADELAEAPDTFWHMVIEGPFKCNIRMRYSPHNPHSCAILQKQLFDLKHDTLEQYNLADERPLLFGYLSEQIRKQLFLNHQNHNGQEDKATIPKSSLDPALKKQLEMLGYLS